MNNNFEKNHLRIMNSIQILGIRGYEKTNHLKSNVEKALLELELQIHLEEISDVDELMKSNVHRIPALRVNEQIVFEHFVPNVEELKIVLKTLLMPLKTPFKMKKILVPVDFSKTAKGAYLFALEISKKLNAEIKLVHCFHPEVDPAFPYLGAVTETYFEQKKERLQKFKNQQPPPNEGGVATAVKVESEVIMGLAADEIMRMSEQPDIDMVVMGTTGEGGFLNKLFGSISSHLALKAKCPVLLIPDGVNFKSFQNVLFASNFQESDSIDLNKTVGFSKLFDAVVHFVHVVEKHSKGVGIDQMNLEQIFQGSKHSLKMKIATISSDSVIEGIQSYATQNEIDLVVFATHHRSFFENMFHKSMTKQMVFNTKIPLLVMHDNP